MKKIVIISADERKAIGASETGEPSLLKRLENDQVKMEGICILFVREKFVEQEKQRIIECILAKRPKMVAIDGEMSLPLFKEIYDDVQGTVKEKGLPTTCYSFEQPVPIPDLVHLPDLVALQAYRELY